MTNKLGNFVRDKRGERGTSLRAMASSLGISAAFLSDLELGRRSASDAVLRRIASFLQVDLDDLRAMDDRIVWTSDRRAALADHEVRAAVLGLLDRRISPSAVLGLAAKGSAAA